MMSPRSPSTSPPTDTTPRVSRPISIIAARETGLARGFAHYEDFPLELYDAFTRYIALGNRLDIPDWVAFSPGWWRNAPGRLYHDWIPRSREHAKNAAAVDRAFLGWLARRHGRRRPFFAFLNYNDAHTPYEVPDRSTPGFGLRPASSRDRLTLHRWNTETRRDSHTTTCEWADDVYDDCIAYLDRRLGMLLQELSKRGVLDDTLVIVTADHGEHLGDHLLVFPRLQSVPSARPRPAGDCRPQGGRRTGWSPSR